MQTQLKENIRGILTESSGIDAWKDVSNKLTNDGKTYFKGTAYFPDISKLDIHSGLSGFIMKRNERGEIVIELEQKDMGADGDEETQTVKKVE